jgi:hypothetical protein
MRPAVYGKIRGCCIDRLNRQPIADKSGCGLDAPKVPIVAVDQSYSITMSARQSAEAFRFLSVHLSARIAAGGIEPFSASAPLIKAAW